MQVDAVEDPPRGAKSVVPETGCCRRVQRVHFFTKTHSKNENRKRPINIYANSLELLSKTCTLCTLCTLLHPQWQPTLKTVAGHGCNDHTTSRVHPKVPDLHGRGRAAVPAGQLRRKRRKRRKRRRCVGSVGSVGRRRRPGRAAGVRHVLVVLARSAVQRQALPTCDQERERAGWVHPWVRRGCNARILSIFRECPSQCCWRLSFSKGAKGALFS